MTLRKITLAACLFIALFFGVARASAHANLIRSEPAANSANPVSPTRVRLWFSEDIEPSFTNIAVLDKSGVSFDKADSHRLTGEAAAMELSLNDLPQGLYTVVWKAISAVDGHATQGSFSFTVGDVPLSESTPREIMSLVDNALSASAPPPLYDILSRWLNLTTLIALVGALFFPLLIFFPALALKERSILSDYWRALRTAPTHEHEEQNDPLDLWLGRWWTFVRAVFVMYALATVGLLLAQAFTASGWDAIPRVLQATRFGTVWLFRASVLLILGVLVFRDPTTHRAMVVAVLLGLGLLFSQSLNSHGAAVSDPPVIPFAVDLVHLLFTAIWVGGLFQLFITVPVYIQELDESERTRALGKIIATFSLIAFVSVGAILLSGAYALFVQVGSFEAFFGTLYGEILTLKFALILPLLALGALNLVVARPAFAETIAARARPLFTRFSLAVGAEIVLAILVVLAVGALTSVAPAIGAYDPNPKLLLQTQKVDDLYVTVGVAPGLVGSNDFDVKLQDAAQQPIANAEVVRLLGAMPGMDMGVQELEATNQGAGHYTLRSDLLSMIGVWNVEVLVRRPNVYDSRVAFNIPALPTRGNSGSQFPALERSVTWVGLSITLLAFAFGVVVVLIGRVKPVVRNAALLGAIVVSALGALLVYQTAIAANAQIAVTPIAPESARVLRSPVRGDPATLAAGKQIYAQNCAVCHGVEGKGDGPSAVALNPKPVDLTVHARLHAEGELFWWVSNGIQGTGMPAWTGLSDLSKWQVIAYIRTLGLPAPQ